VSETDLPETDILDGDDAPEVLSLPLEGWHVAKGARMVEFAGYRMPVQYEGIIAEHLWTRAHAGLFDVSHMGQLLVSAPESDVATAAAALEALLPADLAALGLGRQRYSLLLDEAGGILDDLMATRWREGFYLVVNGATKWDDIAHLREHLPDEITLTHLEEQALLALQGPEAVMALGCRVALDDFGVGYSALGYLHKLRFSAIKVDRSFVVGASAGNAESVAIIRAVVALAGSLGMVTTAEGVETADQLAMVRELGCTKIQGYLFGRPMPAAEVAGVLLSGVEARLAG